MLDSHGPGMRGSVSFSSKRSETNEETQINRISQMRSQACYENNWESRLGDG